MGNLARAGYGATTEGLWPYSYDTCDLGTFPNQTTKAGQPQAAAGLSFLPGQRLSACTCPGSDHPGPEVTVGRGSPEIDIFEAQIDTSSSQGQVSQSFQVAPYNAGYQFDSNPPATTISDSSVTFYNSYKGGVFQQAVSAVTNINNSDFTTGGGGFGVYAFEYWADEQDASSTYITWYANGQTTWTATAASVGADSQTQISNRLISVEPMSIIMNLGMSPSFQQQDFSRLVFPSQMLVDYVRVYQRHDSINIGCDPPNYPTADYINAHINAYTDANLTTWAQAGYTFPRNSLFDGC